MFFAKTIQNNLINSAVIAVLLFPACAHAELNKWEDEKGQTHYGDRVPSEYLRKEHSLLNEQGVTLRTSEAMKTNEELTQEQKELVIKQAEMKRLLIIARKKALRDRVLLDTFTTEKDLTLARDARIDAIDSQISLAETLVKNDEAKLSKVKKRIAEIEKSGRKVPGNLFKKVTSVGRQLENNYMFIEDKKDERKDILKTFTQDVARFKALKKARREAQEEYRK
jgi:Domain of unknown function (DUF4124)